MTQLSTNFSLAELTVNSHGFDNQPGQLELLALEAWAENIGQPIRDHYGLPVVVTSGFRCPALNKMVGGAADSQHVKGEAADIHVPGIRNDDLWTFIRDNLQFDQVIAERLTKSDGAAGWVHVSYSTAHTRKSTISGPRAGLYLPGLVYA